MKVLVAIFMGFFSGFMIYMMAAMISADDASGGPSVLFVIVTFFGGWALTSYLLLKGALSVNQGVRVLEIAGDRPESLIKISDPLVYLRN